MDDDVERHRLIDQSRRDGEFATLFAQLDCPKAVASIEHGLQRLADWIGDPRVPGVRRP